MYTLRHLLESGILSDARLLTTPADLSHIEIRSVSVQEFPLDDFIQKNELVLSTALGCDTAPDRFALLVQGAVDAGAAAVAFAFKDASTALPPHVLAVANSAGLPLLQIPWKLRFSKIQSAVLSAIQEDKLAVFQHTQNQLFDLFFESNPLEAAAACIARQFACPVRITNASEEELAASASCAGADNTTQTQIRIHLNGILMGYLYLTLPSVFLDGKEPLFEKFLAFPLSLWFNKRHIENMTALRLKNDFIRNLATGNYDSFQEMAQQGAQLHFDLGKPYTCIVMKAEFRDGQSSQAEYLKAFKTDLFLSAHSADVKQAIDCDVAAGMILPGNPHADPRSKIEQIRIAFDGDAVLFAAEAERIYQHKGMQAFMDNEEAKANIPLQKGPFANFLMTIAHIQSSFPNKETTPIRTALVTSRNAPAHERAIKTLRDWDVHIDEAFFLGGVSKRDVLSAFGAHIFFDDQRVHTDPASEVVASAVVPYREGDDPRTELPI